uniref:Protein lethal essential for life n=1 Tax=Sipha flava TaxID=143950 RepID=A0A2S2PZF8_9HEMI
MSLLPFLLDELSRPIMYDQNFGLGLLDDDLLIGPHQYGRSRCPILLKSYIRPHRLTSAAQSGLSSVQNDKNNFKVNLDVQQFKPEEVSVKVADGYIVVDGKHEERSDEHGYISRQFTRRYKMPDNVDTDSITSTLSSDGVLSIGASKKIPEKGAGERPIQVVQTNQPIKQSSNKDNENNQSMETDQ